MGSAQTLDQTLQDGSGIETAREILTHLPGTRLLFLADTLNDTILLSAVSTGAHGYVLQDAGSETLMHALRSITKGQAYLDPGVTRHTFAYLRKVADREPERGRHLLSPQERRLLPLIAQGKTNKEIAAELGLTGSTHEGRELDGLSPAELQRLVDAAAVFARVTPEHKTRIVEALQANGHVVAMTGDGVNDAPALHAADIGVAMAITGTAVSREAATMVLADDNFATIVRAIEEGRTIYDNIVKFVRFQLSTNIGAILTVLGAPFLGFATPFTAIQILWVNIIMDGPPAMTLGVEPARPGIMQQPPRAASAAILSWQRLWRIGLYGLTMAAGTLGIYAWGLARGGPLLAGTLAFTTFVLFQFFNIFNARVEHGSAFNAQFFSNGKLWAALLAVVGLQVLVVHWGPAQALFDTVDLQPDEWGMAALVASSTLLLDEARKLILRLGARSPEEGR